MSAELTGVLWTVCALVVVAIIGFIGNLLVKRLRSRASEPEMWAQLDKLSLEVYGDGQGKVGLKSRVEVAERRFGAAGRVIRDLARQWPEQSTPRLNPNDLDELDESTIPVDHPWRQKP